MYHLWTCGLSFSRSIKYPIIYADPPWQYRQKKGQGVAENHYQTMDINDICNLPIERLGQNPAYKIKAIELLHGVKVQWL